MKINVKDSKTLIAECQAECDQSWELVKKANSFPDNISPLLQNVYKMGYLNGVKFLSFTIIQQIPKYPAAVQPEPNKT